MSPFVGVKQVDSTETLRDLLCQHETKESCYFLRWPHQVSGFQRQLPADFPSPEGQLFNSDRELRWKQVEDGYSVLLLSATNPASDFAAIGDQWQIQTHHAYVHSSTETRFPKGIVEHEIKIAQRYFIDARTSTVHFVALTVQG